MSKQGAFDFDPTLLTMLMAQEGYNVEDVTWQNDVCSSVFISGPNGCAKVFSDATDPADREGYDDDRYSVIGCDPDGSTDDYGDDCLATSDREVVLMRVRKWVGP